MDVSADELRQVIIYQIGAVSALAQSLRMQLVHVKPHGAPEKLPAYVSQRKRSATASTKRMARYAADATQTP